MRCVGNGLSRGIAINEPRHGRNLNVSSLDTANNRLFPSLPTATLRGGRWSIDQRNSLPLRKTAAVSRRFSVKARATVATTMMSSRVMIGVSSKPRGSCLFLFFPPSGTTKCVALDRGAALNCQRVKTGGATPRPVADYDRIYDTLGSPKCAKMARNCSKPTTRRYFAFITSMAMLPSLLLHTPTRSYSSYV